MQKFNLGKKAAPLVLGDRNGVLPTDPEVLFLAFLVANCGKACSEIETWAGETRREASWVKELGAEWKPKEPKQWAMKGSVPGAAISLVHFAHQRSWPDAVLDRVGQEMQRWPGRGCCEGMRKIQLRYYLDQPPPGVRLDKKSKAPARWKGGLSALVAELVYKKGAALRQAVNGDPQDEEDLPALDACVRELSKVWEELGAVKAAAATIRDTHRKLKESKAEKRRGVKQAAAKKLAEKLAGAKERYLALRREQRAAELVKARAKAVDESKAQVGKLTVERARARDRARAKEWAAKEGERWKLTAKEAQLELKKLKAAADVVMEDDGETEEEEQMVPIWTCPRREENGRFKADDWRLRPIIYGELARRTPTVAVGANIADVLQLYAPDVQFAQPTERQIRLMRIELTIAGECMAHFQVGNAIRIISFGFDESTKYGLGLLSTNTQIEPYGAPGTSIDVVQRGATLTAGGTAEAIAASIDTNIFSHGRHRLAGWKELHQKKFGAGSWRRAGAPEPNNLGMHRLSENTVLMSDTCSTAEKTKRIVAEACEAAGISKIGDAAWAEMSVEAKAAAVKVHLGHCHQHLRNIIINAMQLRSTESLKEELQDDLAEFATFDRMSVDVNDLIRAVSGVVSSVVVSSK